MPKSLIASRLFIQFPAKDVEPLLLHISSYEVVSPSTTFRLFYAATAVSLASII